MNEFDPKQIKQWAIIGVIVLAVSGVVTTGIYTIEQDEEGVILRLGKYFSTAQPGLHVKIPFGIDRLYRIKTKTVHKQEFGFRTRTPGIRTEYTRSNKDHDISTMLTGDLNVAEVEWVVQYKIFDPQKYIFKVRDVEATLRDMSESIVRSVVGDKTVNSVLTVGRLAIEDESQKQLQDVLDKLETGIKIVTVQLQNVNPPESVKDSYNDVNKAKQDKERMINQANEGYNKDIAKAEGEAKRTVEKAHGYKLNRVNRAEGDAKKFLSVLTEYTLAKEVTQKRIYLEAMENVLNKVNHLYLMDSNHPGVFSHLDLLKDRIGENAPMKNGNSK